LTSNNASALDRHRIIRGLFLGAFTAAGIYLAGYCVSFAKLGAEPFLAPGNALIYLLFMFPLLAAMVGWIAFAAKRHEKMCLVLLSLFWLVLTAWEIREDFSSLPSTAFVLTMLLLSICCFGYLLFARSKGRI
jgi:hypothetical protein